MTVAEITNDETGRIAGILESKWSQMAGDNSRMKAENMALDHALDVMTQDRDYWRERCQESEKERDQARDDSEFLIRQWQGVQAHAKATMDKINGDNAKPIDDDEQVKRLGIIFGADNRTN